MRSAYQKTAFTPVPLSSSHVKAISNLLMLVRNNMPDSNQHWLKPKTQGEIAAHFAGFNPAFGMFNEKQELIACLLVVPLADADDEMNQLNYPSEYLRQGNWAVQSFAVHPDYKEMGFMKALGLHTRAFAYTNPAIDHLIAKVNANNIPSQKGFAQIGFTVAARGQDHASGDPVVYLGHSTGSGLARTGSNPVQLGNDDHSPAPFR